MTVRILAVLLAALAVSAISTGPASAWWQFVGYNPDGDRKVYTPYPTEKACQAALKQVDAALTKKYPKLYPRVGSCEEYK